LSNGPEVPANKYWLACIKENDAKGRHYRSMAVWGCQLDLKEA
jgi:hypothetical protein